MELLQLSSRIKRSSFHFPPVVFAGFFSCPITGSVLLLYQLPSAWRPLLVALFARVCGLHDVAKGVAGTHFRTSVEAREELVFAGREPRAPTLSRAFRQPPPCKNRQSR